MSNLVNKGKLTFHRDAVGKGDYGKVFDGRFEDAVDVTIVRVDKSEFHMNTKILRQTDLHPNIVRFYGAVEDDEFQYIATEMCAGNLKQFVRGECNSLAPHPPIADKEILRQITCGLQYLHEKNICHRDIKPSNIFISRPDATLRPQLKLGNSFGFNRTAAAVKLPLWKLVGMSKAWVAPDIYDAAHTVFTKDMDIFCLGLVCVFVLTGGNHAFGTEKEEIVLNIKKKKPMSFTIQQLKDTVDGTAGIYELISCMLSFNREERPSASDVFNYTFFGKSTFIPKERENHTVSFQFEDPRIKIKREPTIDSEETNDDIPETTTNNTSHNSMPPLVPIRLPSGESLPKKRRQEEEFNQQLPTPPLSDCHSSPFLREDVASTDDANRCLSRTSAASTASTSNVLACIQPAEEIKLSARLPPPQDCMEPSTSTFDLSTGKQVNSLSDALNDVQPQVRPSSTLKSESSRKLITGPDDGSPSSSGTSQKRNRSTDRPMIDQFYKIQEDLVTLCKKETLTEDDLDYLKELVANDSVDINYKRKLSPPLLLLCRWNRSESLYPALQMLLKREDLFIDATSTNSGYDALMFLCKLYPCENLLKCARLLIERGINTQAKEKGGKNALNILWERNEFISKRLAIIIKSHREHLDQVSHPQALSRRVIIRDTRPSSPQQEQELMDLCSLSELNSTDTKKLRLLVSKNWLNLNCMEATTDRTPLLLLCYHNQSENLYSHLQYLLGQKSVNPHAQDREGQNALLTVCFRHRGNSLRDVIDLLLRYDVQVNCKRNGCWNALFALSCDKNGQKFSDDAPLFSIVKMLVDNGLSLNTKPLSGHNILVNLTLGLQYHPDFPDIIRFLVNNGVDPNARNSSGDNALIYLCKKFVGDKNLYNIMSLLIDCGTNVFAKNNDGFNALDILRKNNYSETSEVVKLLKSQ